MPILEAVHLVKLSVLHNIVLSFFRNFYVVDFNSIVVIAGSMPPDSHSIFEEGAVFRSFKIVKEGVFQEEGKMQNFNKQATSRPS